MKAETAAAAVRQRREAAEEAKAKAAATVGCPEKQTTSVQTSQSTLQPMHRMISRIINSLKDLDNRILAENLYVLSASMKHALTLDPFVVADIGAAYGIDPRWKPVQYFSQFLTFEPDPRSQDEDLIGNITNFATGLGNHKGYKTLYLTNLPAASSIYRHNLDVLRDYANYPWHEVVDEIPIQIDTLDSCISNHSKLRPNFLKVDVEGADLDVIKGAEANLGSSILGIQVEVSFIERHVGAPFFSEIDEYLREQGFSLFVLAQEHWLRSNMVCGVNTNPQVIWADGVYVLNKAQFISRLKSQPSEERFNTLVKFLVILLSYGFHDFAYEIIDVSKAEFSLSGEIVRELKHVVNSSILSPLPYSLKCITTIFALSLLFLISSPIPSFRKRVALSLRNHSHSYLCWGARHLSRGGYARSAFSDKL